MVVTAASQGLATVPVHRQRPGTGPGALRNDDVVIETVGVSGDGLGVGDGIRGRGEVPGDGEGSLDVVVRPGRAPLHGAVPALPPQTNVVVETGDLVGVGPVIGVLRRLVVEAADVA